MSFAQLEMLLNNRRLDTPDANTIVRVSTLEAAVREHQELKKRVSQLEAERRAKRRVCECCGDIFDFEVSAASEAPPYRAMEQARLDRLNADDDRVRTDFFGVACSIVAPFGEQGQ